MIRLTQLAVSKRSVTVLITLAMLLGGVFAWASLKQELLPNIAFPYVVVITPVPGASAQDVAVAVTEPVERSIGSLPALQHIDSSSVNSLSIVVASFDYGTDVKGTTATIDANVKALGLTAASTVESFDINALPPLTVAIQATGSTTTAQLDALAGSTIVPALESVDGVSTVDLSGASQERLMVELDPAKLAANNISISQISGVLAANNLVLPAGSLPTTAAGGSTINIPVSAQHQLVLTSANDLLALTVGVKTPTAGSGTTAPTPITLGDLGTVKMAPIYASGYAELNSDPSKQDAGSSLVLSVSKTSDANTVDVVQAVQAKLAQLQSQSGAFQVVTVDDLSSFIIESRDSLVREGILGALFAIITIFIFLMSLRSTLVAAVSIPVSIMTALVLMLVAGVTINIMTLGGLAVAVGRVVDDAIVVLENIYRPFALTVTFALLASLVCALTVVPVMATLFIDRIKLNPDEGVEHHDTIVQRIYTPLLRAALHNRRSRWSVIGISALLVVFAGLLVPHIPTQFLDTGSQKYLQISVAPPSGTPSASVLTEAKAVEAKLRTYSEINLIETTVPGDSDTGFSALEAAFTGGASNSATIVVRLDNSVDLNAEQKKLAGDLASLQVDSWQIQVAQQSMTGSGAISVVVSGTNPADVTSATAAVVADLKTLPDLINVKSDLATTASEYQIDVDPNKAILDGTSTECPDRDEGGNGQPGRRARRHLPPAGLQARLAAGAPTDARRRREHAAGPNRHGLPAADPGSNQPRRSITGVHHQRRHDQPGHRRRLE